jgi:hypothetical protein
MTYRCREMNGSIWTYPKSAIVFTVKRKGKLQLNIVKWLREIMYQWREEQFNSRYHHSPMLQMWFRY